MNFKHEYMADTIKELLKCSKSDCVVFFNKPLNCDEVGIYISALANQAVLCSSPYAYALWGFNPETQEAIGTDYSFNQETIVPFLSTNAVFTSQSIEYDGKNVVILEVQRAADTTIQYRGDEYILYKGRPVRLSSFQNMFWRTERSDIVFEHTYLSLVSEIFYAVHYDDTVEYA